MKLLAIASVLAACSSSPTNKNVGAQQGQRNDAGQDGHDPGIPNDPPIEDPGEGPDDPGGEHDAGPNGDGGGSGDGGTHACVFNPGSDTTHESGWRPVAPLSTIGQTATNQAPMVWTGHELLVFGSGVAASYAPSTDTWKALPESPIGIRSDAVVELAGDKLVVWGGGSAVSSFEYDGAIFDLCTATWEAIPKAPIVGRSFSSHAYATTTGELVVWGGNRHSIPLSDPNKGPSGVIRDGAAYDLKTKTWRMISNPSITWGAFFASAWTGTTMVMYGGGPNHGGGESGNEVAAYDPVTDTWTTPPSPELQGRQFAFDQNHAMRGTTGMTAFGGSAVRLPLSRPGDGATFDFATSTWTTIPVPDAAVLPDPMRMGQAFFWIGDRFYTWGGTGADRTVDASGAVFDPSTRTWTAMPGGGPSRGEKYYDFGMTMNGEAFVWSDTMMVFRP
jgi:hypothetical protein